jgi:glycosyltransferase involved in cell wall biosynthesis
VVSNDKRIVMIATVGGTLLFFRGLGERLRSHSWTPIAFASEDGFFNEFCKAEGFVPYPISLKRRITPLADGITLLKLWFKLIHIQPKIVHAHTPKAGLVGMVAACLARVPVRIYTVHGVPLETATGLRFLLLWVSDCLAFVCATELLCVSYSVKAKIKELKLPRARTARVLLEGTVCGIDDEEKFTFSAQEKLRKRAFIRQKYSIPEQAMVVGFIGRFVKDKGIAELVDAWRKVSRKGENLWVIMVGDKDPCGGTDNRTLQDIQDEKQWIWTGWDANTAQYYSAMDFLVLPSYREGFPTVVLEAAALEVPSIVTDATGCIDAVIHDQTGLVVPVKDSLALADAFQEYIQHPNLITQHGRSARMRVAKYFQRRKVQEALVDEYDALISIRKSGKLELAELKTCNSKNLRGKRVA